MWITCLQPVDNFVIKPVMEVNTAKRPPGRPKGSKNKRTSLAAATVRSICEDNRFNPAQKLIDIAKGNDLTEEWDKNDKMKATMWLADAVHNKPKQDNPLVEDVPQNYEIVFIESEDDFALPGAPGPEVAEEAYSG